MNAVFHVNAAEMGFLVNGGCFEVYRSQLKAIIFLKG